MPASIPRKMNRVMSAVTATEWAITEEKFDQIRDFLARMQAGEVISDDEIEDAIASQYGRDNLEEMRLMIPAAYEGSNKPPTINGVRVLSIYGTLSNRSDIFMRYSGGTSTIDLGNQIAAALRDEDVRSILIDVDSPGGITLGVAELATQIFDARGTKPIYVIARGLMASAAYWIGSAAEKVYATESSLVGSIGVIAMHIDRSKANEAAGETHKVLRSIEGKVDAHPSEPLTAKAEANAMARIKAMHSEFVLAVARNRNVDVARVDTEFGGGQVMLANQAAKVGMIDGVRTFESVLRELSGSTPPNPRKESSRMNAQIKSALHARGWISQADATDEHCESIITGFFAGQGKAVPDDAAVLQTLNSWNPSANAGGDDDKEKEKPKVLSPEEVLAADRNRRRELASLGEELGIDRETIDAACDDNKVTADSVREDWKKKISQSNNPISQITPGPAALDMIVEGATESIMFSQQMIEAKDLGQHGRNFAGVSLMNIARSYLSAANQHVSLHATDEDIAEQFLKAQGWTSEKTTYTPDRNGLAGNASSGSNPGYASPSRYPALLDNLAFKIFAKSMEVTETTYRRWCGRGDSVPDFEMHTIYSSGEFPLMSPREDGEKSKEATFGEEVNWVQVDNLAMHVKLTPRMIVNDARSFFSRKLAGLQKSHDLTLNQMMVNLLVSQEILPSTNQPLFSQTTHNNIVTAGSAPSVAQLDVMRKLLRQQKTVDGEHSARLSLDWMLVPTTHETTAQQVCLRSPAQVAETVGNKNVFAGTIDPIVEPELDQFSTDQYYAGSNPMSAAAILYLFLRGYENGRIQRWYDPSTGCWFWEIQGAFGGGIANYRPILRNNGTGG